MRTGCRRDRCGTARLDAPASAGAPPPCGASGDPGCVLRFLRRPSAPSYLWSAFGPRLLLVALLGERRRQVLAQHGEVDVARRAHVGARLREPVEHRAGVGRGEEVQVLAARVEDRLGHLGQAVGDGERLVLVDRVERDGHHQRAWCRSCRPATSSRATSAVRQLRRRRVGRLRRDLLRRAGLQIDPVERLRVVDVGDLLAVGRPHRILVEAVALERQRAAARPCRPARRRRAGTRRSRRRSTRSLAVGRPGRRALVDAGVWVRLRRRPSPPAR